MREKSFNGLRYHLLPRCYSRTGQLNPIYPLSGAYWFVVSCGFRLSEVGFSEFRKPQVGGSIPLAGCCYCIHITKRATFLG